MFVSARFGRLGWKLGAVPAVILALAGSALVTAGSAAAEETTVELRYPQLPGGGSSMRVRPLNCPAKVPYLKDHNYSTGRWVPNGVEVIEMGGVGVTLGTSFGPPQPITIPGGIGDHPIVDAMKNGNTIQWAIGTTGGSATNWAIEPRDFIVKLWCTSNRAAGWYQVK